MIRTYSNSSGRFVLDGEHLAVRHAPDPAHPEGPTGVHGAQSSAVQSLVSRISLTRARKFAA